MSQARVERRLAAILAVDVAGYSRLMGEDEEGTLAALRAVRRELADPKIAEHRGRIVKTTGDGLLVEFASVVDAVRCAVEVQREMIARNVATPAQRRIEFRMGINLGDIISEDGDIFGDGVNITARLEALAEPGGICLSAAAHEQVRDRLDIAFDDLGEQQVKNITRPVRTYGIDLGATSRAAVSVAVPLPLPNKPSLAVLPFQNLSSDPEQEYFTDGMVEDITTAIARLPWLFVIARNSSFTYKGKAVDVKQVGRELGVRYVLEGSVRKAGNRVRITGQLIDATTATHIWADQIDGSLDDIFELQDRVTSSVVGAIEPKLRQSEIERAIKRPSESLDAYDLYLRALAEFYKSTPDRWRAAISLLRQALEIDPSYAAATGFVSYLRAWEFMVCGPLPQEDLDEAVRLARHAIDIGKDDPDALWMAGAALATLAGAHAVGTSAIDRALMLNPNCAQAWHHSGVVNYYANRPDAAIVGLERAMRLSPLDPHSYQFKCVLGGALMLAGRYQEAMEWVDRSLHDRPNNQPSIRAKIALTGHLGRMEEAREWISRLNPSLTIAGVKPFLSRFLSPGALAVWEEGYRCAGLPEK
jgi:TolB-like protein/class 3 adenylate cyclase/Tfp pilus assembly protein PilF